MDNNDDKIIPHYPYIQYWTLEHLTLVNPNDIKVNADVLYGTLLNCEWLIQAKS